MRLTQFSDYSFRLLMLVAAKDGELATIEEASKAFRISRTHLMKVANALTKANFLKAVRGRSGGLILAKTPADIRLGDIVRVTEPDFNMVECFSTGNACTLTRRCHLAGILRQATFAFLATLDQHTLVDLMLSPSNFGVRTT